jgi:hypothetical protein
MNACSAAPAESLLVARGVQPRPGMTNPRPGDNGDQVPEARYRDAEAELGGADAVEKTTYVEGRGTSPEARTPPGEATATVPSRGVSWVAWGILIVIVLLAIAYLGGAIA